MLRIFAFGPNFVFRTNFVFATEFRLRRAPNRISSSHEFRLQGRFSSSNFVFAHNLSFSSWRTISSSKASEFRLQGGDETGTQFPGSMQTWPGVTRVQNRLRGQSPTRASGFRSLDVDEGVFATASLQDFQSFLVPGSRCPGLRGIKSRHTLTDNSMLRLGDVLCKLLSSSWMGPG